MGSGPVAGVIEASSRVKSIKALLNYYPSRGGIEFIFDPKRNIFLVGTPKNITTLTGSPHQQLARCIGADELVVLGGMFARGNYGSIMTREASGHYWQNWTPIMREQFINYMKSIQIVINHEEGP